MSKKVTVHLLDQGGGVIESLVTPLVDGSDQHIAFTSYEGPAFFSLERLQEVRSKCDELAIVLHSSGRKTSFFQNLFRLSAYSDKLGVLMHVNPHYFLLTNRSWVIDSLKKLQTDCGLLVLTPGKTSAHLYMEEGMEATPIQFGIDTRQRSTNDNVKGQRNLVITSCTNDNDLYRFVKGIDRFRNLSQRLKGEVIPLIAGFNGDFGGVRARAFSRHEFESLLADRALAYVQLSRTEAYNLTAVQAKRHRIPVVASDVEGHIDNLRHGFRVSSVDEAIEVVNSLSADALDPVSIVNANYCDSIQRESFAAYKASLEGALGFDASASRERGIER